MLELFWDPFGFMLESLLEYFAIISGCFLGRFFCGVGIVLGSCSNCFSNALGSVSDRLRLFWD